MARNAAAVLGGLGDAAAIGDLSQALHHDPEPLVRVHAAWALGQIGTDKARQILREASMAESSGEVLSEINSALARN
jgi:epoxyqueuosine reductase